MVINRGPVPLEEKATARITLDLTDSETQELRKLLERCVGKGINSIIQDKLISELISVLP